MTQSYQWYGAVTYNEDISPDVTAGLAQMERWNTPTTGLELSGSTEVMTNLSRILAVAEDRALARLKVNAERILAESQKEVPVDMTYESRSVIRAIRSKSKARQWTIPSSMQWAGNAGKVMVKVRGRMRGGWLKSTGTVEPADDDLKAFQIGYNTPYAHRQHEDLTYRHTRPGAKAKYLEDPAMRIAPTIAADIAEALKDVLS